MRDILYLHSPCAARVLWCLPHSSGKCGNSTRSSSQGRENLQAVPGLARAGTVPCQGRRKGGEGREPSPQQFLPHCLNSRALDTLMARGWSSARFLLARDAPPGPGGSSWPCCLHRHCMGTLHTPALASSSTLLGLGCASVWPKPCPAADLTRAQP